MNYLRAFVTRVSPIFLVSSPVTSYADQIYSIHTSRSLGGFSLDIPLIMLVASITKIFYWFGVHYDTSLLIQAILMIIVQSILLFVALQNRAVPSPGRDLASPFAGTRSRGLSMHNAHSDRPYAFWQWRTSRPFWTFLGYLTLALTVLHIILGGSRLYVNTIGYVALAIEATLPLPQIQANHRNRSCRGFRLSVLINWLIGDVLKMSFFFMSDNVITWAFKLCGLFQFACDIFLGVQYLQFGNA